MKNDVKKELAEIFLKAIKEEPLKWMEQFTTPYVPQNGVHGNKYKGYNKFYLSHVINARGYNDFRFYPQSYIFGSPQNRNKDWDDPTKIKVKKGEKPVYIETAFFVPTKDGLKPISMYEYYQLDKEERKKYRPIRKPLAVYNAEQLTGVPEFIVEEKGLEFTQTEKHEAIDRAARNMSVKVTESKACSTPCYVPFSDEILLPAKNNFKTEDDFAAVKLHEMAHATGAESRLNRDMGGHFGGRQYAIEELRAEISSAFMAQEFGFDMDILLKNHKAYVQSWAEVIGKDEKVLIKAILDAEKITDFIEDKAELKLFKDLKNEDMKRYGITHTEWDKYMSGEDEIKVIDSNKKDVQIELHKKIKVL